MNQPISLSTLITCYAIIYVSCVSGFQGWSPSAFPRVLGRCSQDTQQAWLRGLNASLWALYHNFTAPSRGEKKKKIICNRTGGTFNCDIKTGTCYCTASNDERWGGGSDGVAALESYRASYPDKGVIVHVPHNSVGGAIFNSSLASFLLASGDGDGYGVGFGYECREGGWLEWDSVLDKPLGQPIHDAVNQSNLWRRSFSSGTRVYMNATKPAVGYRLATCIVWADGTETARNNGCEQLRQIEAVEDTSKQI